MLIIGVINARQYLIYTDLKHCVYALRYFHNVDVYIIFIACLALLPASDFHIRLSPYINLSLIYSALVH